MDRQTDGQTDKRTDRWTDGQTDGRMDGRMEIRPCVLQDIGSLGPLPKKEENGRKWGKRRGSGEGAKVVGEKKWWAQFHFTTAMFKLGKL